MRTTRKIKCLACGGEVDARLTDGSEINPHSPRLRNTPYWVCDACRNYVGCHPPSGGLKGVPLGSIPTPELRAARRKIHFVLDPLWRRGPFRRRDIYKAISKHIGYTYHTANLEDVGTAEEVYGFLKGMSQ